MNARAVVLLALVVGLGALATGFWLLFRVTYLFLALLVVSYVWTRLNVRGVRVERHLSADRAYVGETVDDRLTVRNRSRLPKVWLEVRDHSDLPDHRASAVVSLPAGRGRTWTARTVCRRRGRFTLGPVSLWSGDAFGLFTAHRLVRDRRTLLVYPRVVDLPLFALPTGELPGGSAVRRRTQQITPNVSGVRDYAVGDSFKRVHWPSTARAGRLIVKEFELDPTSDVWLLLDLEAAVQAGEDLESTEEYAVTAAASIAKRLLDQTRAVGLLAVGQRVHIVHPDRGARQLIKLLETLALVRARGTTSLAEVIAAESLRFVRQCTVVAITPSSDESWVDGLQLLAWRGVRAVAVVLERGTFGAVEDGVKDDSLLLVSSLAGARIPSYLVKRGEPLERALASAGLLAGVEP